MIGLALHEEQDDIDNKVQKESLFKFLEKSFINKNNKRSLEFLAKLSSSSSNKNSENLSKHLNDVISVMKTESYKYFTEWILGSAQKILKIKHKLDPSKSETENDNEAPKCSTHENETAQLDEQMQAEKRKHQIAEKRRARIMAKLNKMQKNFIEKNQEFYNETKTNSYMSCSSESEVASMNLDESESLLVKIYFDFSKLF